MAALYPETAVVSVADFVRQVNDILRSEVAAVWVEGEISNLTVSQAGHAYFTLKDADAALSVAMFAPQFRPLRFRPKNGMQVIVHGRTSIYPQRGQFQLVADRMLPQGEGLLQLQFQQLVERLKKEGLFDDQWKRPIPPMPERIGVVTSIRGAAVRDFLRTLFGRWPGATVVIADSPVQGEDAPKRLVNALFDLASHGDVDVIALVRGGGSIEDLWAFNDEDLARAIRSCPVPVVTGVGHESDVTIADFAADLRASTPTQAAMLLSRNITDVRDAVHKRRQALVRTMDARLQDLRLRITSATGGIADPRHLFSRRRRAILVAQDQIESRIAEQLAGVRERLEAASAKVGAGDPRRELKLQDQQTREHRERLIRAMDRMLDDRRRRFLELPARLDAMSPLKVLSRGYSVLTTETGRAVRNADEVAVGDRLTARLYRGKLTVQVKDRQTE